MEWWIDEPVFLGTSNPSTEQLKNLHQQGFKTVISLVDFNEQLPNYDIDEIKAMGFQYVSIPIKNFTAPTEEMFKLFLETVEQSLKNGKVVMHCEGGSGRTGTMAAAYWIKKGLPAKDTIDKVRKSNRSAVETSAQKSSLYMLDKSTTTRNRKDQP